MSTSTNEKPNEKTAGKQQPLPVTQLLEQAMPTLTPSQKKLADLIYMDLSILAFEPAVSIGQRVGVSEATVHRLATQLGFNSFSDMQKYAQQSFSENRTVSRLQRAKFAERGEESVLQSTIELDILNLETTFQGNSEELLWKGAELIAGAQRIYVAGWRAGLAVTASLNYTLNLMLGNSELLPMYGGLHERLCSVGEQDLVIAMGFPRYCNVTLDAMAFARNLGAKSLVITDTPSSPFVPSSTVAYYVASYSNGFLDSYVAPLSLTNALVTAVSVLRKDDVMTNLKRLETVFSM